MNVSIETKLGFRSFKRTQAAMNSVFLVLTPTVTFQLSLIFPEEKEAESFVIDIVTSEC